MDLLDLEFNSRQNESVKYVLKYWKHFWVLNKFYFSRLMCRVDGVVWALVAGRGPLWGLFFLTQQGTKSLLKNLTSHWDIKATPPCHASDMGLPPWKSISVIQFLISHISFLLLSISLFNFQCAVYLLTYAKFRGHFIVVRLLLTDFLLFIKLKRKLRDLGNLSMLAFLIQSCLPWEKAWLSFSHISAYMYR